MTLRDGAADFSNSLAHEYLAMIVTALSICNDAPRSCCVSNLAIQEAGMHVHQFSRSNENAL